VRLLLVPPLSLFVLAAIGLVIGWRWRRFGKAVVALAAILLVLVSMPAVSGWLMQPLQIYPPVDPARIPANVGAIVILSGDTKAAAAEYGADVIGPITLERVRYGAHLHRRTGKPVLVSGGFVPPSATPIARQMRDVLIGELNVPVKWTEDRSLDTHQNAVFSSQILREGGVKTVLLVTHAWHMRRAMAAFRAAGIEPIAAPTRFVNAPTPIAQDFIPTAGALLASSYAVHEWLGLVWYYVAGYTSSFS
jgi:uncharacterized SAM-binding protein YcdF (DUF218 family)